MKLSELHSLVKRLVGIRYGVENDDTAAPNGNGSCAVVQQRLLEQSAVEGRIGGDYVVPGDRLARGDGEHGDGTSKGFSHEEEIEGEGAKAETGGQRTS